MSISLLQVHEGIYAHVTSDSPFNTAMGGDGITAGRVYLSRAVEGLELPYAVMEVIDDVERDTMDADGYVLRVQFSIWEDKPLGVGVVLDHFDKLVAILHRVRFPVEDHDEMTCVKDISRGPIEDDQTVSINGDFFVQGYKEV